MQQRNSCSATEQIQNFDRGLSKGDELQVAPGRVKVWNSVCWEDLRGSPLAPPPPDPPREGFVLSYWISFPVWTNGWVETYSVFENQFGQKEICVGETDKISPADTNLFSGRLVPVEQLLRTQIVKF